MCGIVGAFNKEINRNVLDIIKHRGPDDTGWFEHKNVTLGHVRLSIQDVSEMAHQPFLSKDGNTVMVFNGKLERGSKKEEYRLSRLLILKPFLKAI